MNIYMDKSFEERLEEIVARAKSESAVWQYEQLKQLFLDIIAKAKPEEKPKEKWMLGMDVGYNQALEDYYERLIKEVTNED